MWARLHSSLWPLPVLAIVVAIGLAVGLPALDQVLQQPGGRHPLTLVFGGGPSAARDVLAAIAGSLISVTGLTFSFTVVALQLASSQHSPRFLQTFVTDRVVQATLALLVGTFVYALTVLRTVRTEESTGPAFVPRLSVTVGFVLALASVVGLVLFLGHLARSLRVETMLRDVSEEARDTYARELPGREDDAAAGGGPPSGPATPVPATESGFVTDVNGHRIAAAAAAADVVVLLEARIGDSVVAGTPLAHVWPCGSGAAPDLAEVERAVQDHVHLGFEPTPDHDIAYSLRKVVDIAVRALSPGTNDPTTAVHALSHVSALLGELVTRPLEPTPCRDGDGVLRFVLPQWDARSLLRLGLEEPITFAEGQPAVLRRLARLLRELAWRAAGGGLDQELRGELERVVRRAEDSTDIAPEEIASWRSQLADAFAGRWFPTPSPAAHTCAPRRVTHRTP
ncbi:DUF2254 domain-containing protein [Geodermatophilus sp. SYSU D01176]